ESRDNYAHGSGIFWIVAGSLFLLGSMGILRVALRDLWPVVLIGIGSLMLWRYMLSGHASSKYPPNPPNHGPASGFQSAETTKPHTEDRQPMAASSNSTISAMAILSGVERRTNSQDFRGSHAT